MQIFLRELGQFLIIFIAIYPKEISLVVWTGNRCWEPNECWRIVCR